MLEELGFSLGFTTTIGIIMIVITLFVHRHTFIQDYELGHFRRLKLPIWLAFFNNRRRSYSICKLCSLCCRCNDLPNENDG